MELVIEVKYTEWLNILMIHTNKHRYVLNWDSFIGLYNFEDSIIIVPNNGEPIIIKCEDVESIVEDIYNQIIGES